MTHTETAMVEWERIIDKYKVREPSTTSLSGVQEATLAVLLRVMVQLGVLTDLMIANDDDKQEASRNLQSPPSPQNE